MPGTEAGVSDDDFGECVMTQLREPGGTRLRIDRADQRIRIAGPILEQARSGDALFTSLEDGVLTIRAENRTVAYRIGAYHEDYDWYEAERAD